MSMRGPAATLVVSLALALASCATPVMQASVDVPGRFAATESSIEPEAVWWDSYGDPVLSGLIRRAAYENRDVKIAAERVLAARADETISRSRLFPSVDVGVSGTDQRTGYSSLQKHSGVADAADAKSWQGGLEVSWEVDISGRLRAGAQASAAEALAAEDGARGVRLMVLTDVAANYFTLTGALRQLDSLRAISAAYDNTLRLTAARQRAGLATPFDVERAQSDASRARAAIPPFETLAAKSRNRIAVLIGDQAFNAASIVPGRLDPSVPTARPGQPADLLQRRPDLLKAQAELDAANARRQQAHAEWFPRLVLGALFGGEGLLVNGLSFGAARFANVAAMLAMPIFNAGRTQAINDIAESNQREAVLNYEEAIVTALEEVENGLTALGQERQRMELLQAASASAESALGRAQSLYDRGQIDLLPLLDAQRARLTVSVSAIESNTELLLDSVQLYKALGGGWQVFEPVVPAASDATGSPTS